MALLELSNHIRSVNPLTHDNAVLTERFFMASQALQEIYNGFAFNFNSSTRYPNHPPYYINFNLSKLVQKNSTHEYGYKLRYNLATNTTPCHDVTHATSQQFHSLSLYLCKNTKLVSFRSSKACGLKLLFHTDMLPMKFLLWRVNNCHCFYSDLSCVNTAGSSNVYWGLVGKFKETINGW